MDPISSTYGNTSVPDSLSSNRKRQQVQSNAPVSQPDQSEVQLAPAKPATTSSYNQLGFQPSESTKKEFQPYSPENLRSQDPAPDPAVTEKKDPQPLQTREVQQEDPQTQQVIAQLKSIEEKVKTHEAAHKSGGAATGPISYTYTRGPDGKNYITGGEVPITISSGHTPQETISRMQQVIQAALAPADPSPQDRAVAAQAAAIQQAARQEQAGSQTSIAGDAKNIGTTNNDASKEDKLPVQQSRQAYNNPAVTGKDNPNGSTPASPAQNYNIKDGGTGPSHQSNTISSMTTGLVPPQRISVYN